MPAVPATIIVSAWRDLLGTQGDSLGARLDFGGPLGDFLFPAWFPQETFGVLGCPFGRLLRNQGLNFVIPWVTFGFPGKNFQKPGGNFGAQGAQGGMI